jgi:cytochrome c peroxidase
VDAGILTAAERAAAALQSPLPAVPADPTNAFADVSAAATLGQRLFFERSYSGTLNVSTDGGNGSLGDAGVAGLVNCNACHASAGGDDNRSNPNNVSLGTDWGPRNALPVVNSSFYAWTNWGGRFDTQWSLPLAVAENAKIMKSTRLDVAHMLFNKYRADYDAIFPVPLDASLDPAAADASRFPASGKPKAAATDPDGPWELMAAADRAIVNRIFANYGKAIAAYLRLLVSRNAPFDQFVAGNESAISDSAKRGLKVFLGKGNCVGCHSGPDFEDGKFHALGVPQTGPHVPANDFGRFTDLPTLLASAFNSAGAYSDRPDAGKLDGLALSLTQMGQFRTKSLRTPSTTAPYMHAGQFSTLEQVIDFYDLGGGTPPDGGVLDARVMPLGLTANEKADLAAFLRTLDGDPLPSALTTDTSH